MVAVVKHEHWSSRFTFIMAAVGSAVGLGNIWRFPYITGENGGGAIILIYLATMALIPLPILIAEIMLGRMSQQSPINAIRNVVRGNALNPLWQLIGWGSVLGAFIVLSYYSVIGGWAVRYMVDGFAGAFAGLKGTGSEDHFAAFTGSASSLLFWHTAFMAVCIAIVVGGLKRGIELAVSVLMPLLFALLVALVVYAMTTPGFLQAFAFIFNPDFSKVTPLTFLTAIGQGFFSLSVALAAMMTYGAYLDRDVSIGRSALWIAGADTLVALLAGLAIFPLVFSFALEPGAGPGLIFVTLPTAFGQLGSLVGGLFFLLLTVAAVTSAISLLEPVVSWSEERFGASRPLTAIVAGIAAWFLGIASALSFNAWAGFAPLAPFGIMETSTVFDVFDFSVTNLLMPTIGLLMSLLAGWALTGATVADALGTSAETRWFKLWRFAIRFLAPAGVVAIFIVNVVA